MFGRQHHLMEADGPPTSFVSPAKRAGLGSGRPQPQDLEASVLSQEQVAQLLFDAFSRRALTDALRHLDPEIVFEPMTAIATQAGKPYRGHAGIESYMQDVEAQWKQLTLRPGRIRVAGDAAVILGTVSGQGPAGSFEDVPTTWILKFRNGRVIRAQIFSDARPLTRTLVGEST